MARLRKETPADAGSVADIVTRAFGKTHAARNIWQLRAGAPVASLGMVAMGDDDALVGSCRYWPITLSGEPALLFGPLAVLPELRGRGIGKALVRESLAVASGEGAWRWCFISGEPGYYTEFGFHKISAEDVDLPAPIEDERLHLLDFRHGRLVDMPPKPWIIRAQQSI